MRVAKAPSPDMVPAAAAAVPAAAFKFWVPLAEVMADTMSVAAAAAAVPEDAQAPAVPAVAVAEAASGSSWSIRCHLKDFHKLRTTWSNQARVVPAVPVDPVAQAVLAAAAQPVAVAERAVQRRSVPAVAPPEATEAKAVTAAAAAVVAVVPATAFLSTRRGERSPWTLWPNRIPFCKAGRVAPADPAGPV